MAIRRSDARTYCAGCGIELTDANCYRHGGNDHNGFRIRCTDCEKARRQAARGYDPNATCKTCGSSSGMARQGRRRKNQPEVDDLRASMCTICRRQAAEGTRARPAGDLASGAL